MKKNNLKLFLGSKKLKYILVVFAFILTLFFLNPSTSSDLIYNKELLDNSKKPNISEVDYFLFTLSRSLFYYYNGLQINSTDIGLLGKFYNIKIDRIIKPDTAFSFVKKDTVIDHFLDAHQTHRPDINSLVILREDADPFYLQTITKFTDIVHLKSFRPLSFNIDNFTFLLSNSYFYRDLKFTEEPRDLGEEPRIFLFGSNICFSNVSFYDCTLHGDIAMGGTHFFGNLDFVSIETIKESSIDFSQCILPDTLSIIFSKILFNDLDLTTANFSDVSHFDSRSDNYYKRHSIFLYNVDYSKIKLDYRYFKLIFTPPSTIKNPWPYIPEKLSNDEIEIIYENLLTNFKNRGQQDSYRLLDLEYQEFKGKNSFLGWLWWVPKIWWNYGYTKELIFIWSIFFVIFFSFINYFKLSYLIKNVYKVKVIPEVTSEDKLRRLWYSLVYTSIIFFSLIIKLENINFKNIKGTVYIMTIYISGIICLGYIANYIIQR